MTASTPPTDEQAPAGAVEAAAKALAEFYGAPDWENIPETYDGSTLVPRYEWRARAKHALAAAAPLWRAHTADQIENLALDDGEGMPLSWIADRIRRST